MSGPPDHGSSTTHHQCLDSLLLGTRGRGTGRKFKEGCPGAYKGPLGPHGSHSLVGYRYPGSVSIVRGECHVRPNLLSYTYFTKRLKVEDHRKLLPSRILCCDRF